MTLRLAGPLLLVGAGKMGGALLEGWLAHDLDPKQIFVRDPAPPRPVAARIAKRRIGAAPILPDPPSVVVLAVKPQLVDEVLAGIGPLTGKRTVLLSIVAGRTLADLARNLPKGTAIVRAMPNTPASIRQGISVAIANAAVTRAQKRACDELLAAVGDVVWIDDESLMDAVTAVSGSGPAYVFLLAECLAEAGTKAGLDKALAEQLARATVAGAGALLRASDLPTAELRKNVISPKGTTAAALEVLMGKGGFEALLARAVKAAAKRSKELSS
jgi:pyrroline-5-carboxylate reductase